MQSKMLVSGETMAEQWFEKSDKAFGVRPMSWQGRFSLILYAILVLLAFITYSNLGLSIFVVAVYSTALGGIIVVKSDLYERPEDDGPGSSH